MQRPNIKRRIALAGGTALIAAAGVGGYLAMSGGSAANVHLTSAPALVTTPDTEAAATAPDTDTVQQGGQSGVQDTTGVDTTTATTTAASGAEAPSTEADSAGGNADAAGAPGQDGNFNN